MDIDISIRGTTPLICNKFTDAAAIASTGGRRPSAAAADRGTPQEIAVAKLYIGLNGNPIIPQPNLLRCLVDGGRFHKIGRAQVTTKESSLLYACLDIEATEIPLEHEHPWRVDCRAVVIPATKGRILCHRPMFDDWRLTFSVNLDITLVRKCFARSLTMLVVALGSETFGRREKDHMVDLSSTGGSSKRSRLKKDKPLSALFFPARINTAVPCEVMPGDAMRGQAWLGGATRGGAGQRYAWRGEAWQRNARIMFLYFQCAEMRVVAMLGLTLAVLGVATRDDARRGMAGLGKATQ
jgi:hypothetical protein